MTIRFDRLALGASAFLLSLSSCATPRWAAANTMAEEKFPSRAEVKKFLERPPKFDTAKYSAEPLDSWELAGPFPSAVTTAPVAAVSLWEKELVAIAPAFAQALTEDQRCIAREVARYHVARKQYPGHSLQRFIELRCATAAKHVNLRSITGTVPAAMSDEQWFKEWKGELTKLGVLGTNDLAGIAAVREGDQAVLVIAKAEAGAVFSKPVTVVQNGMKTIELRGHLARGGAHRISALINQGTLDTQECRTLDALTPPEFAFECTIKEGDTRTMVEVAAFDEGRILGRKVVDLALYPTGDAPKKWARAAGSVDVPNGLLASRFIAEVNAFRTRAGLSTLTEAPAQSQTATSLAPYYFAAQFGEGEELDGDLIALAMMAGWDVGIDIVSSGFGNDWLSGTRDLSLFLEFLLDSPYQRRSLTDPRATHIAVGTVEAPGALAALFATYVPLPKFDRKESEIAVITRLNTLRRDRGLPLAQWTLWPEDEGALIQAKLAARKWDPSDASQHALNATAEVAKGRVTGYVQLVDDLEHFQFPPEVLLRHDINVFLAVGTYKGENWAQTRYVVCFVIAAKGEIETASR